MTETDFSTIPAGAFRMGQRGHFPDEEPVHTVVFENTYYMGITPVTQAQFAEWTSTPEYEAWFAANKQTIKQSSPQKVANPHQNSFDGDNNPADSVTWWEAKAFADWLDQKGSLAHLGTVCLPTEAQWEHACRAGSYTNYWNGDQESDLDQVGWYSENTDGSTKPVAQKIANQWGLHDMHGNVAEWCLDYYDPFRYRKVVNNQSASHLSELDAVEFEAPDDDCVNWARIMHKYTQGDTQVTDEDRPYLERLLVLANHHQSNNPIWLKVSDALNTALQPESRWPNQALDQANILVGHYRSLVEAAENHDYPARVLRGGAWNGAPPDCRSACRNRNAPGGRYRFFGFRLAVVPGSGAGQQQKASR